MTNSRSNDIFDLLADVIVARQEPWRAQAACRGDVFKDLKRNAKGEIVHNRFFPKEAAGGSEAKAMCKRCPVQAECEADHHAQPPASQHYGIWYNTRPVDREAERKSTEDLTAVA